MIGGLKEACPSLPRKPTLLNHHSETLSKKVKFLPVRSSCMSEEQVSRQYSCALFVGQLDLSRLLSCALQVQDQGCATV